MQIILYIGLACLLLILLLFLFSGPLLTRIGKIIVRRKIAQQISEAGLVEQSLYLPCGSKAWYLERPSYGQADGPPLIVLPGGTLSMVLMGVRLWKLLKSLPRRRILVVELPQLLAHGR